MRSFRDELNQSKDRLQQIAGHSLSKEQLKDVEHYHNQFHIQLINIHDLKQSIKAHNRRVSFETAANNGQLNEDTVAEHENLFDQFQTLSGTLQELKDQFSGFSRSL